MSTSNAILWTRTDAPGEDGGVGEEAASRWQPNLISSGHQPATGFGLHQNPVTGNWCLVGTGSDAMAQNVLVNGEPLRLGLRVLKERDRLLSDEIDFFFSRELPATIETFPETSDDAVICGRCRNPLSPGESAVRCPGCRTWSHETEELPCFTYPGTETCPLCDQPNRIGELRWSPAVDGW